MSYGEDLKKVADIGIAPRGPINRTKVSSAWMWDRCWDGMW